MRIEPITTAGRPAQPVGSRNVAAPENHDPKHLEPALDVETVSENTRILQAVEALAGCRHGPRRLPPAAGGAEASPAGHVWERSA